MSRYKLLNTVFDNVTTEEVLDWIDRQVPLKNSEGIVELNVDVVMKMEEDELLRKSAEQAGLTLIDGKPLMWISKYNGVEVREKISGSDLMPRVCAFAAEKGYKVMIMGGSEDSGRKAKENLENTYPSLDIITYSPPMGFEKSGEEREKIEKLFEDEKPDVVFLCLGCPKQEKWWLDARDRIKAGVFLCAGASVDFIAGNVKRAPAWMSNAGLEWFYRFLMEPKRLFKRYFVDDMKIIKLVRKYRQAG